METVLLVGVDSSTTAAIRRIAADLALLEVESPRAMETVERYQSSLGAVVLGTAVENPVSVATAIRAVDREPPVIILCSPSNLPEVARTLRFTPLGRHVECRASGSRDVVDDLPALVARTYRRRNHHAALRRMDVELRGMGRGSPRNAYYLDRLLDNAPIGVALVDRGGQIRDWNRMAAVMLERAAAEVIGVPVRALFPGPEGNALENLVAEGAASGSSSVRRTLVRRKADGTRQYVEVTAAAVTDDKEEVLIVFEDITLRRRAEEQQHLIEKVFSHTSEAIFICDKDNRILSINPAFTRITGYGADEVVGRTPAMLKSGRHDQAFYRRMWASLADHGGWSGEIWDRRKDGEIYSKWLTINTVRSSDGSLSHYVAIFSDNSERQRAEARIHFLAHHDTLTELPNRFALRALLPLTFGAARRQGTQVGVLFIDLDRFRTINDSLGHPVGDLLLIEAARRIQHALRQSDTVARVGGDEFVVVLADVADGPAIAAVADKLIGEFRQPIEISGNLLCPTASVGISVFPADGETADSILMNAETAMYHAKAQGRNAHRFFSTEMNQMATERLAIESRLRQALERDEISLDYQPQVDGASGRVIAVEALARWYPPGGTPVPPVKFIPVAEETGLIGLLGERVLNKACRQLRQWLDLGILPVRMAVNVSALQLRDRTLPEKIEGILAETGIAPEQLEIEVTESAAMTQPQEAISILNRLKTMGISVALDDFGTGYSSLAYLKLLPIDRLKIDRAFVAGIGSGAGDVVIARSTIALGHSLGLKVVAEGVETAAQWQWLVAEGCDETQGYFWSVPLSAEAATEYLRRHGQAIGGPDSSPPTADRADTGNRGAPQAGVNELRARLDKVDTITGALATFLRTGSWGQASQQILATALDHTGSEYGFLGILVGDRLRILAHSGFIWSKDDNRAFYEQALATYKQQGYLEFGRFDNLFGTVVTTGKAVRANDPAGDPRAGHRLPAGHPPLDSFLGVPMCKGEALLGMVGVANRPGGYTAAEQASLEALAQMASVLYDSYQQHHGRLKAERDLHLAAKVLERCSEGIIVTDSRNTIVSVNPAFSAITGYPADEVVGKQPAMLISRRHDAKLFEAMAAELRRTGQWQGEVWGKRRDGGTYPGWVSANAIFEADTVVNYVAVFSDISKRKAEEAHIEYLAHFDSLTGLPNRAMLMDRLERALVGARRRASQVALLFLDLDRFKAINDSLGHPAGDLLLKAVAARLLGCLRKDDIVARLAGDEFIIVLPDVANVDVAADLVRKISAVVSEGMTIEGHALSVTPSIGLALFPRDGDSAEALIAVADQAMYRAKNSNRALPGV